MIELKINIDTASDKWKRAFPRFKMKIETAAACAFLAAKKPAALKDKSFEMNIILTTDANVKKLNKAYRGKDKATNVLSFPQIMMRGLKKTDLKIFAKNVLIPMGDIVLAQETIVKEAKREKKELEHHVAHLVIHGVLHLLGYDHMNAKDIKAMETEEVKIMTMLGYPNPYKEA